MPGEVPVVPGPDDAPGEEEHRVEVDQARRGTRGDEPDLPEHDRDQDGGEELEEALDPQMDDPESPVVDDREVGVGSVEHRRNVEDRDCRRRVEEQRRDVARSFLPDRRPERPEHQEEPEQEADHQQELPEAAEVQVLGPLMPEPEPELAQPPRHTQELADQAAADHQHQRPEEHVDQRGAVREDLRPRQGGPGTGRPRPRQSRSRRWRAADGRCAADCTAARRTMASNP